MDEEGHTVEMHKPEAEAEPNPPEPAEGAILTDKDNASEFSLDLSGFSSDKLKTMRNFLVDITYELDGNSDIFLRVIESHESRAEILTDMEARLRMREELWRISLSEAKNL